MLFITFTQKSKGMISLDIFWKYLIEGGVRLKPFPSLKKQKKIVFPFEP